MSTTISVTDTALTIYNSDKLSDQIFYTTLGKNKGITELTLHGCVMISPQAFMNASFPSKLKVVDVSHTNITNRGLQQIFKCCQQLHKLDITWCTAITIPAFNNMLLPRSLHEIDLSGTSIRVEDLNAAVIAIRKMQQAQTHSPVQCVPVKQEKQFVSLPKESNNQEALAKANDTELSEKINQLQQAINAVVIQNEWRLKERLLVNNYFTIEYPL